MRFLRKPMSLSAAKQQFDLELKMNQQSPPTLLSWSIRQPESHQFFGVVYIFWHAQEKLQAEMGIMLLPDQHGHGIASECIAHLLNYAFNNLGIKQMWAKTNPENTGSCKTLQKNGFKRQPSLIESSFGQLSAWVAKAE